jgi:hypothetical protein
MIAFVETTDHLMIIYRRERINCRAGHVNFFFSGYNYVDKQGSHEKGTSGHATLDVKDENKVFNLKSERLTVKSDGPGQAPVMKTPPSLLKCENTIVHLHTIATYLVH